MNAIKSKKTIYSWGVAVLLLLLLALLPVYGSPYSMILATSVIMYAALTVSYVLFSGPTGNVSLASAAFMGIGIYTSAVFGKILPLPVVILLGACISFLLALLVGALTLRLKGLYFSIFTFGLVLLIRQLVLWYEAKFTHTRGRFVIVVDNMTIFYVMLGIFVVLLITAYLIRQSRYGAALESIGEDEEAAAHTGVNVTAVKTITFAVSALFMGATGAIMATKWTYIDSYIAFDVFFSFTPVLMAVFGGMATFYGPIVGAAIFGLLEELLLTQFPFYYMLLFGVILVVAVTYLPNGLIGLIKKLKRGGRIEAHANP